MIRDAVIDLLIAQMGAPVFDVTIDMVPVAASRPRARRVGNRAKVYMPTSHEKAEEALRWQIQGSWKRRPPLDCPLVVVVHSWVERRKTDRGAGEIDASSATQDADNLAKLALDACTQHPRKGPGVWTDDRRVVGLWSSKSRHAVDGQPGVRIVVWRAT